MNARLVARVLWVALLVSVLLYVGVVYAIPVGSSDLPVGALMMSLYVVCAILVVSSLAIYRRLLRPDLVRKYGTEPLTRMGLGPSSEGFEEAARPHLASWILKAHIVAWAVAEAVSLLGLVGALITAEPSRILPFAVASFLLLLRMKPDFSALERVSLHDSHS